MRLNPLNVLGEKANSILLYIYREYSDNINWAYLGEFSIKTKKIQILNQLCRHDGMGQKTICKQHMFAGSQHTLLAPSV